MFFVFFSFFPLICPWSLPLFSLLLCANHGVSNTFTQGEQCLSKSQEILENQERETRSSLLKRRQGENPGTSEAFFLTLTSRKKNAETHKLPKYLKSEEVLLLLYIKHKLDLISSRELVAGIVEEGGAVGGLCPGDSKPSVSI